MAVQKINPSVFSVGAKHWDRRLFDELIPLPDGTTYNSYVVRGSEKTALIDTVDPEAVDILFRNLREAGISGIDYVVANHAEQDHSGSIPALLERFPEAQIVTNQKCRSMLLDLLELDENSFVVVDDNDVVSLGDKTLQFFLTPWVHWPETMVTYLKEDGILFSCDFFGSHFVSSDLFAGNGFGVYESAKRYYAEIMMPFRKKISGHLTKLEPLDIRVIAPSHGQVFDQPEFILNAYRNWISDEVKSEVVIPYVSMHGSTAKMVEYLTDSLIERGIAVKPFNLTVTDIGDLAINLVDAATIVIASPTVLTGPHPSVAAAAFLANALRPKARFAAVVGSYGWGGRLVEKTVSLLGNLKVELLPSVIVKGHPGMEDFKQLDDLAELIQQKHRDLNL